MSHSHHDPKHSHSNQHSHSQGERHAPKKSGIHKDWRFWAVIAMLVGMGLYIASENEMLPIGGGQAEPEAEAE